MVRCLRHISFVLLAICWLWQPLLSEDVTDDRTDSEVVWPTGYAVQQTGQVNAAFDCYGCFSPDFSLYPVVSNWPNVTFESPSGSNLMYLWFGGICIGGIVGSDTLVSTAIDGYQIGPQSGQEFCPPDRQPSVTSLNGLADMSYRAKICDTSTSIFSIDPISDRPHLPLSVEVAIRSHAVHRPPFNKAVIYDLVVTNVGDRVIEEGFFGVFLDPDVYYDRGLNPNPGWDDDLAGSLREHGIVYALDNNGDPVDGYYTSSSADRLIALRMLRTSFVARDTCFNWWQSSAVSEYDFGPRRKDTVFHEFGDGGLGTPDGDIDKYHLMSFPEWDYDQVFTAAIDSTDPVWLYPETSMQRGLSQGGDVRFMLSTGPFELEPDSSMRLLFTMFTGEFVHYMADNFRLNIAKDFVPQWYLYNLNFSDALSASYWAGVLADSLLQPDYPPIGLKAICRNPDSIVVEWDPWVFDEVEGYDIYLGKVPADSLPYPGLAPPWPVSCPLPKLSGIGRSRRYVLDDIDVNEVYQVAVANRTAEGAGQACDPVIVIRRQHFAPPVTTSSMAFFDETHPARLIWRDSSLENIDHYSIYRFDDISAASTAYHPFYDSRDLSGVMTPTDSFTVGERTYYYYAMEVYAQCDSGVMTFEDPQCSEGITYVVSAVNKAGFESDFSPPIEACRLTPRQSDILVMTNSALPTQNFVSFDSVKSFYDSVLGGLGAAYDYDIYNYADTVKVYGKNPIDWRQLLPYRLVIVDDGMAERIITGQYEDSAFGFTHYLSSGGRLVCFGAMTGMSPMTLSNDSAHIALDHWFLQRFFAADSEFFVSMAFFILNTLPLVDDIFAFTGAEAALEGFEDIDYDTSRYPFVPITAAYWPPETGPAVAVFGLSADAELVYRFRSRDPALSCLEGQPVGLRSRRGGADTYLFGFHLWYMKPEQARRLIDAVMVSSDCCLARGDFNHSGGDSPVDITDLAAYVFFLFGDGPPPPCQEEADVNGDGLSDIIDLTVLADFIFKGGIPLPACP